MKTAEQSRRVEKYEVIPSVPSNFPNGWQVPSYESFVFRPKQSKYLLVIPVLNEADRIQKQMVRLGEYLKTLDSIVVDGGSNDGSVSADWGHSAGLRALFVKTGAGKLSAQLRIGLAWAMVEGYQGVILMDGNNKDRPDALPRFVKALEEGYDNVQGSRFLKGGGHSNTPWSRLWGIRLIHSPLVSLFSGFRYTDTTNGFKAYSRKLITSPAIQPFRDVFDTYELHTYIEVQAPKMKYRCLEIPVVRAYPSAGPTPTKISGFRGNLRMFKILLKACLNRYRPKLS